MADKTYPYFKFLLSEFENENNSVENSFGRHVHWGYWQDTSSTCLDGDDYAVAAENLTKQICSVADIKDHQTVLDVGCGFGGTLAYINESHQDMDLAGVNIDKLQLERAEKIVTARAGNRLTFTEADACDLPYENEKFDRLLAVECIFHFPGREIFFAEAYRVLKTGGSISLTDFIPTTFFLPMSWFISGLTANKYSLFGACDIKCTLPKYRKMADKYGFSLEAVDITAHTLPTYGYLKSMVNSLPDKAGYKKVASATVSLLEFISRRGLLTYQILKLQKY